MKILNPQSATLSNSEVLSHILTTRAKPRSTPFKSPNLETVIKELREYLLSASQPPYAQYTADMIKKLVGELEIYQLTKAEALMMLNLRPRELGLLDCVIEECDLRFDEGQQERVLEIVGEVLAEGGEEGEEEGEGEKEGA